MAQATWLPAKWTGAVSVHTSDVHQGISLLGLHLSYFEAPCHDVMDYIGWYGFLATGDFSAMSLYIHACAQQSVQRFTMK